VAAGCWFMMAPHLQAAPHAVVAVREASAEDVNLHDAGLPHGVLEINVFCTACAAWHDMAQRSIRDGMPQYCIRFCRTDARPCTCLAPHQPHPSTPQRSPTCHLDLVIEQGGGASAGQLAAVLLQALYDAGRAGHHMLAVLPHIPAASQPDRQCSGQKQAQNIGQAANTPTCCISY
jgi:hypothetical protein